MKNGYAYVALDGSGEIEIEFDMPVRLIAANRRVHADAGRVAIMRGPVVYCAEGLDNGDPHPSTRSACRVFKTIYTIKKEKAPTKSVLSLFGRGSKT